MKKCILIPDSFKGNIPAAEVCAIMQRAVEMHFPQAEICAVPAADGGEGTVDAFLQALGGQKVSLSVKGPFFEELPAFYGILPDRTAVIEMAAAAGLPQTGNRKCVEQATTFGVGQMLQHAIAQGCRKIILTLGGSATNDGGCGAAAAMGAVFQKADGTPFVPVGETLGQIAKIDLSALHKKTEGVQICAMCDVTNPLCGKNGAAAVFAPQKGANAEVVGLLDRGLHHLAEVLQRDCKVDILSLPGAGAAGGMGGGMVAFFGSPLQSGIETFLDTIRFDELLHGTDLVFTGEGKLDSQSLGGKVISGVARRTKRAGIPLIAVVGDIEGTTAQAYDAGVSAVFSINRTAVPFRLAKQRSRADLF